MKVKVIVFATAIFLCIAKGVSQNGTGVMQLDSINSQTFKNIYDYDSRGYERLRISYRWDNATSDWIKSGKTEYTHDDNGNLTMDIRYNWDNATTDWIKFNKNECTYDNNGNQTMWIRYNWDNATTDWIKTFKNEYTYNLSYSKEELILPYSFNYPYNNMLTELKTYSWNGTDWNNPTVETYYWSSREITGISEAKEIKRNIKVYPNPTKGELRIDNGEMISGDVEILDVVGRVVFRSEENTMDISHLAAGIYFLKTAGKTVKIVKD